MAFEPGPDLLHFLLHRLWRQRLGHDLREVVVAPAESGTERPTRLSGQRNSMRQPFAVSVSLMFDSGTDPIGAMIPLMLPSEKQ